MNRHQRAYLLVLFGVGVVWSGACGRGDPDIPAPPCPGGKCDAPGTPAGTVGHCVPFNPLPGYQTCVMSEPQIEVSATDDLTDGQPQPYTALPKKVDHRDYLKGCVQAHDQGSCGWCTAHATTASLEAMLCKDKQPYRRISEPHLWWLGKERGEFKQCKGGWYISSAFSNLGRMTDKGFLLVRGSVWPYSDDLATMNKSKPTDSDLYNKGEHGMHSKEVGSVYSKSTQALKQALAAGHNVVYSIPTFKDVGWKWWESDYPNIVVPTPTPPGNCKCDDCPKEKHCLKGYHAILIVGYDDTKKRFDLLNSWSSAWGSSGFGTIDYATISKYGAGGRYPKQLKLAPTPVQPPKPDAGLDSSQPDLGASDLGAPDLGASDLGAPDLGAPDLGAPDGAKTADLGASDTSPVELGPKPPDSGSPGLLDLGPLPANGGATCAAPALLPLINNPTLVTGTTKGAPNEFGLSITCGTGLTFDGQQRYYRLELKTGATFTIQLKPQGFDAVLYAYPDTNCSAAAINGGCQNYAADKWGADGAETLTLTPSLDQEWIVTSDSFDPATSGSYTLTVSWQ